MFDVGCKVDNAQTVNMVGIVDGLLLSAGWDNNREQEGRTQCTATLDTRHLYIRQSIKSRWRIMGTFEDTLKALKEWEEANELVESCLS
ncbi:MAG: hypothetical protein U9R75_08720, partial [Candidatus Thermoplasmatota archaeon]|nr:hypothetical protein [Candidatus Thermoplasmatota archaeon]